MKTKPCQRLFKALVLSLGFLAVAGKPGNVEAASQIWDGGAGGTGADLGATANWTNDTAPAAGDTGTFDGTVAGNLSLTYTTTPWTSGSGLFISLSGSQTGSVTIDDANTNELRLGGVTIAAGAGAFALGSGSGGTFNWRLGGGTAATNSFINNSSNTATFGSELVQNAAPANGGIHTLQIGGSGNWVLNNSLVGSAAQMMVTKTGTGTLTLNGSSSHAGTTTFREGVIAIGNDSALGTGTFDFNSNASGTTVQAANATARTISNPILMSASATFGSVATGNLRFAGNMNAGGLSKTFTVNNAQTEFGGIISGSGSRIKAGAGTLILSGTNTYTGATTVSEGTLLVNSPGSLSSSSAVSVSGSGSVLGGSGTIGGATTISNGGALTPRPSGGGATTLTFGGNLTLTNASANFTLGNSASGSNDKVTYGSSSTLTLDSSDTINITNMDGLDTANDYPLFTSASGTVSMSSTPTLVIHGTTSDQASLGSYKLKVVGSSVVLKYIDESSVVRFAINPLPADRSAVNDLDSVTSLAWSATVGATPCAVYFGDESQFDPFNTNHYGLSLVQANVTTGSIPIPQPLAANRVYYWVVDCKNPDGSVTPGTVWRFYTPASGGTPPDIRDQLLGNNVSWATPGATSADSMPLGNGDIALNVWTEANGDLLFYVGKGDSWSEATRLLKLARVRVKLTPNPFVTGQPFRQTLKLRDGAATITAGPAGQSVTFRVWVDANHPVARVECTGEQPFTMQVKLLTWRNSTATMTSATSQSYYGVRSNSTAPAEAADVVPSRSNMLEWYHRNTFSFYQATLNNQHLSGFETTYPDPYLNRTFGGRIDGPGLSKVDSRTLATPSAVTSARFRVHALTAQTASVAAWESALDAQAAVSNAVDWAAAWTAHTAWWDAFWNRSWIVVSGDTDAQNVTQAWFLQRFMMACQSRGVYPVKFNGGALTFDYNGNDPDFRTWGPPFWQQNTRLLYWPMLATNDTDLLQPYFRMYENALPLQRDVTQLYWNHGGAFFPENPNFYGLYNNDNFGWGNTGNVATNSYIKNHHSGGLDVLTHMLDYYDYERDEAFVTNRLVPYATEIVRFYDLHWPRVNGVIKFYPINGAETYCNCTNPMDVIAGLRSTIPRLLALKTGLTTAALRVEWQNCLDALPPVPVTTSGTPNLKPAEIYGGASNTENVALHAVFPYRLYGPSRPDLARAVEAYHTRPVQGLNTSWHLDAVNAAAVGLRDEAKARLLARFNAVSGAVRFPAFWLPGDYMPDLQAGGVMSIALQDMLLQRNGDQPLMLPAWPQGWDAKFKLRTSHQRTIDCIYSGGVFQKLQITQNSSDLTIVDGETLSLPFNVTSYANGNASGTTVAASSSLVVTGNLVNQGTLRLTGDAVLSVGGVFTNNGILDIMNWNGTLPAGFVNQGIVLDRTAVKVESISIDGNDVKVVIQGYAGHHYQLQTSDTLASDSWANIGDPVAGANAPIVFIHSGGANASGRYYRAIVTP